MLGVSIRASFPAVAATTSSHYVSVNIDASQMARVPYSDTRLRTLASNLGGRGYLRVGGTDADATYYDMTGSPTAQVLPPGYKYTFTAANMDDLCTFSQATGMQVVFGLNAGKGTCANGQQPVGDGAAQGMRV